MNYFASSPRHPSPCLSLLRFLVASVLATTAAKLLKLKPVWSRLLILGRNVVAALAVSTLENNIIARHFLIPDFRLPISNLR